MRIARLLRFAGLTCLLAILAIGPFFQGLFFWTPLLAAIALLAVGFGLWLLGHRLEQAGTGGAQAGAIPGGWAGAALLALLLLYIAQIPWAVFPRGNVDWILRVAAGWFAYVMIRAEAGPRMRRVLGWTFVISAVAVGLLGFLDYTGYFTVDPDLGAKLALVSLNSRMFTSFQYPNTAAVYFLAAVLTGTGLGLEDLKPWKLALTGAALTFLNLAFFFTVSRGAVVVLPFGLLVFFAGLSRKTRWPALLQLLVAAVPMVAALRGVGANSAIHNYISAFRWIGAATLAGAVGGLATGYFLRLKPRIQLLLVGGAIVLASAGFLAFRPTGGFLPKQAARLLDMNFRTQNAMLRLVFDKDALRILADHPLGRGGWAWDRSYRQYQEFNYTARETHNNFLQMAVDTGVPGLLALVGALGAALWAAWTSRRSDPQAWSMAAGAALIAGHSLIDFDLSFGVIWLLLWSLLAAAAEPAKEARWERRALWPLVGAATGVAALSALLFTGSRYTDEATRLAQAKQPDAAAVTARQAVRFDPWDTQPLILIDDQPALQRAARLDPNNSGIRFELALNLEHHKDLPGALAEAKAALADQPMISAYYSKVASLTGLLMVDAVGKGDRATATQLAQDVVKLAADLQQRKAAADPLQYLWAPSKLQMDADFQLRYGQALFLTGRPDDAIPYLTAAGKVGLLGSEAHVWLYAIYEKNGNKAALADLADKPWIRFRNVNPVYKAITTW